MNILIKRYRYDGASCDSEVYVNGVKVCDAAENARHRIPPGRYSVELRHNVKEQMYVPTLTPLDGCMAVRRGNFPYIKIGNGVHKLFLGQIIVGELLVPGVLIHSTEAFEKLIARIKREHKKRAEVILTIRE